MQSPSVITDLRPLYPELERRLVTVLRSLSADDWNKPTICSEWCVKDIASHLLDGHLRKLSINRDGYFGVNPGPINSYADLVAFLNNFNADWVKAARRLSPTVLIEMIERSSGQVIAFYGCLDLNAISTFPVAWAGEEQSQNWFDIAREYTERWHHQQQIRLATGHDQDPDAITERTFYHPVLDTFMRALPFHFAKFTAPHGSCVTVTVSGKAGDTWAIVRDGEAWKFADGENHVTAKVIIPEEIAWRVVTKGIPRKDAIAQSSINGDKDLGEHVFSMLAVMA